MQKIYVATEEQLKTLLNDIFKDILSDKPEDQNNSQLGDYIEEKEAIQLVGRKTTWYYNMRVSEKLPYTNKALIN